MNQKKLNDREREREGERERERELGDGTKGMRSQAAIVRVSVCV